MNIKVGNQPNKKGVRLCQNVSSVDRVVLGLVVEVHIRSMNTAIWTKRSVSFAVRVLMVLVVIVLLKNISMVAVQINVCIVAQQAQAHVVIAHTASTKSNLPNTTITRTNKQIYEFILFYGQG